MTKTTDAKGDASLLCVHPNYELYGSDRSFASTLAALRRAWPSKRLKVLLPRSGPLLELPVFKTVEVETRPSWILRRRDLLRGLTIGLPGNIALLWAALKEMNRHAAVYINTIIGIDFILMARFSRRPAILHVREIPNGLEMSLFRLLILFSGAKLVFNSHATRNAFRVPATVESHVVYNGCADPGAPTEPAWKGERPLRILVIGRLNHWKGQESLIDAIALMSPEMRQRVDARIVGGTFNNQDDFRDALLERIARNDSGNTVRIEPFEDDPSSSYQWADVVVVPSRLPEPFGRVAIEAMSFGKPVICAAHGGLVEIVIDGETGQYFAPSDAEGLRDRIETLLARPELVAQYGKASRERFLKLFTNEASDAAMVALIGSLLDERAPEPAEAA